MTTDKTLTCSDCGQEFTFTASEQDFYAERGFTEPRRCASCRASRKAARNAEGGGRLLQLGRRLQLGWRRRLRVARTARDVPGHVLVLRAGDRGPVQAHVGQARLLQRLLRAAPGIATWGSPPAPRQACRPGARRASPTPAST